MTKPLFSRPTLGLATVLAAFVALPVATALAATPSGSAGAGGMSSSSCPSTLLTQPFLSYHDRHWYTLAPGESSDSFDGDAWTLSGGATVVTETLADGQTGSVLDLPPGSSATSPMMCVRSGMPQARMITQTVGSHTSSTTTFQVWNTNGTQARPPKRILGKTSWDLSPPVIVAPGNFAGIKQVYFTFTSHAKTGDLQLYNFYVDPHMRG